MIDLKIIELINKDIDKTISSKEKKKLGQYLESNPEAKALQRELVYTEELLDQLPNNDPSENLKKRILNSIDYNRYASKKKKTFFQEYYSRIMAGPSAKIVTSFSIVIIIGMIILFSFYINSDLNNSLNDENVYGTIGLNNTESLEIIKIDIDQISGDIKINRETNIYRFIIDVNSEEQYNLHIEFDPTNISFKNDQAENNDSIIQEDGSVIFANSKRILNELVFTSNNLSENKFSIELSKNNRKLFHREILLTNP